jgi:hypothetical protein
MGRFTHNGKSFGGTDSEEFHNAMQNEAGSVECSVCHVKQGQGKKGDEISVCIECIEYVCSEHEYRHPNCSNGR